MGVAFDLLPGGVAEQSGGGEVEAHVEEGICAGLGSPSAGDLLLELALWFAVFGLNVWAVRALLLQRPDLTR